MRELVGRLDELAALRAALAAAAGGTGRLVLIRGEAGIGKTALASALADVAGERDALVAWGSAWEDGGAPAYWPWVQVLRTVLKDEPDALPGYRRPLLARLLPELAGPGGDHAPGPPGDATSARFALFDAVAGVLAAAAERRPLLVVIDDLHAAGAPSALLLKFVGRAAARQPILLVAAYRPVSVLADQDLGDVVSSLEAAGELLRLDGLPAADVARLLAAGGAGTADDELVTAITRRTEGNPLFVREVTRLLRESSRDGRQHAATDWQVPSGIRDAVRSRVAPELRDALAAAGVLGREFEINALAGLTGRPTGELLGLLDRAAAVDLVRPVGPGAGRYRFSHTLVGDALAAQLPADTRARLHAEAGTQLARLAGAAAVPARIAHHYLQAGGVIDPETASQAAAAAGDEAMHRLAYEEAAGYYADAIRVLDGLGSPEPERRCGLQLALGDALTRGGNPPRAKVVLADAAELARRLDDPEALARAALLTAERLDFNTVERSTLALLAEAADALAGADSPLLARVLARLAVAGYHADGADRRGLAAQAVAVARRSADPGTLAGALSAQLYADWGEHDPRAAADTAAEIVLLADAAGDPHQAFDGHTWLVNFNLELGDIVAVERAVAALQRLADALRQPFHRLVAHSRRSTLAMVRGDLAEAHTQARLAWEAGTSGNDPDADAVHWCQVCAALLETELPDAEVSWMEATLRRLVERSPLADQHEIGLVLSGLLAGRAEEARARFAPLASRAAAGLTRDMMHVWYLAMLARGCAGLSESAHAAALYRELVPFDGRCATGGGQMWLGAVSYHLGLLAATAGRRDDAVRHLADALGAHGRMGARPMLARSQLEYARLVIDSDPERAHTLLAAAAGTAEELGLTRLRAAVEQLRTHSQAGKRPTLRQEGDYWTVGWGAGPVVRVANSKGLHYLRTLMTNPGREISALDLARGPAPERGSGADELLDATAREAYRRRLAELHTEREEAQRWHDTERAARIGEEIDFLERELVAAVGLGGRPRRLGSDAERARVAVTRAIRSAIRRIAAVDGELGAKLDAAVRTGTYCSFVTERATQRIE